jgi:hypothetical protein
VVIVPLSNFVATSVLVVKKIWIRYRTLGVTSVAGFRWITARRFGTARWRTPNQGWWLLLRRPDISFSHGAEWNALISRYIQAIPFSADA